MDNRFRSQVESELPSESDWPTEKLQVIRKPTVTSSQTSGSSGVREISRPSDTHSRIADTFAPEVKNVPLPPAILSVASDTLAAQRKDLPPSSFSSPRAASPFVSDIAYTPIPRKRKRKPVFISLVLLALLGIVGYAGWWWFVIKPKNINNVTIYTAHMQTITQSIGGGGITFPLQQIDLSYPASERVISLKVKAGDQVSINQPLLQLDTAQLNVQIKQGADDVAAAQAYLNTVSASGNAVQIAQAQQQLDLATSRYNALLAQTTSSLIHDGTLLAPMSGTVTALNVDVGQQFAANTPLLTIMDESTIIVRAKIPLMNMGQVHIGQHVSISPSALPDITEQGTVSQVIPRADPQTDTFDVWISIVNKDNKLVPGMSAFVHIETSGRALVVPRLAVLDSDTNPQVFEVGSDHRVHLRYVHVVGRSTTNIFIDNGLSAGDRVVLVGLDDLQDGQIIRITKIYE